VDDSWYLSLFAGHEGRLRGEMTPDYSMLEGDDVDRVRDLAPNAKIIYFMRDPLERAWSQLRFSWPGFRPEGAIDLHAAETYLRGPTQRLRGSYPRTLATWQQRFPPEQLFVGFYDDIVERPSDVVRSLLTFLGADTEVPLPAELLRERVNASPAMALPPGIHELLAGIYRDELEELAARFGGHAARWRDAALAPR
jgi:hypothetical protein